jgi:5-methyltetrahydrofolate--homocysteine methyltransferase
MSRFLAALHSGRVLLMDGAMGTELRRAGLRDGECGEAWNLTHPERVRAIPQAYADAGAEVLLTNTFQANPTNLARHGRDDRLEVINQAALRLARAVAGRARFVLADVGPILSPDRHTEFADRGQLGHVVLSLDGADAVLFETCSSPQALVAVQYVFHRVVGDDTPLLLSLAYRRTAAGGLTTFSGHPPESYARHAERHGVAALGVNCGRDIRMEDIIEIVRRYRDHTDLPLFARPSAGTPTRVGGQWVYQQTPEDMTAHLPELLEAGVSMVGGCCGTAPAHIAAFRPIVDAWNHRPGG